MKNNTNLRAASMLTFFLLFSVIAQAQTPFFTENFSQGIPTTWTTNTNIPKFMSCDSNCLKDFGRQNSDGFYSAVKRFDDPNDINIGSTFQLGTAALKMHRNTNMNSTLTTPAINCSGKNKVFLSFPSLYWGGANTDSVLATGNAASTCRVRVSRDGATWTDYPVFDFNIRRGLSIFLDVSAVAANQSRVFVQFRRTGDEDNGIWLVDDVRLLDAAPLHNVTVSVDMSTQRVSSKGVYIANDLTANGEWKPNAVRMTNKGNGIYEGTMSVPQLSTVHYKFMNGDSWGENESVPIGCGMRNAAGYYDRVATGQGDDFEMPMVCFSTCMNCGNRVPQSSYQYCPRDPSLIYCENFEAMQNGKLVPQVSNWTTLGLAFNGYTLANVNDNPSVTGFWSGFTNFDGTHALRVQQDPITNTYDEPLMYLGNPTEGSYQIDFKIYLPKDRSGAISFDDVDGISGFTLDFSNDSLYLLAFLDYIDFDPHLMAAPAKVKQDDWNDISLVFSPATNRIMVKLNGLTLLNAVDAAQTGYTYLDFSTLDVITAFGLRTEFYVDDIVYRRIPTVPNLQSKTTLPNVASITPNPANEQLVISPDVATRDAWQVRLLNNLGQAVLTQQGNENAPLTIAINDYKSGIYFVEFKSETAQWTKKVVIQH